jgi:A/G-specific adenine glycosylase
MDVERVLAWYRANARDLPWRRPDTTPWGVLVSEVMLQQTQVSRVLPAYLQWLARWPTPAALAAESPGEAVRMWARLGYPRRALRLHECAIAIQQRHAGQLPTSLAELLRLPGVGTYTARAVAAFAFRQRQPVVDTNVRRVIARAVTGCAAAPAPSAADLALMSDLLPLDAARAAAVSVAVMELGAVLCTARTPRCDSCPLRSSCAWRLAGSPPHRGRPTAPQRFAGTDRQVRGLLLGMVRSQAGPVPRARLDTVWPDHVQRARALDSLVADGLLEPLASDGYQLPSRVPLASRSADQCGPGTG